MFGILLIQCVLRIKFDQYGSKFGATTGSGSSTANAGLIAFWRFSGRSLEESPQARSHLLPAFEVRNDEFLSFSFDFADW